MQELDAAEQHAGDDSGERSGHKPNQHTGHADRHVAEDFAAHLIGIAVRMTSSGGGMRKGLNKTVDKTARSGMRVSAIRRPARRAAGSCPGSAGRARQRLRKAWRRPVRCPGSLPKPHH